MQGDHSSCLLISMLFFGLGKYVRILPLRGRGGGGAPTNNTISYPYSREDSENMYV